MRPTKKAKILTLKKLGLLKTARQDRADLEGAKKTYDTLFLQTVDVNNFPALRDLFPAARDLSDEEMMAAVQGASQRISAS